MSNQTILKPIFSFPDIIRSREPRALLENRLIAILTVRLKALKIIWNPTAFRGGLHNPQTPPRLLKKLESLILAAEVSGWDISNALERELDEVVEDIETFNPAFRKRLAREQKAALHDFKAERTVSQEELERRFAIT